MKAITIILSILKIIFGPIISRISWFKRKSQTREAYEEADRAEEAQAQAEEQVADLESEREHQENMSMPDKDFWEGGKW